MWLHFWSELYLFYLSHQVNHLLRQVSGVFPEVLWTRYTNMCMHTYTSTCVHTHSTQHTHTPYIPLTKTPHTIQQNILPSQSLFLFCLGQDHSAKVPHSTNSFHIQLIPSGFWSLTTKSLCLCVWVPAHTLIKLCFRVHSNPTSQLKFLCLLAACSPVSLLQEIFSKRTKIQLPQESPLHKHKLWIVHGHDN